MHSIIVEEDWLKPNKGLLYLLVHHRIGEEDWLEPNVGLLYWLVHHKIVEFFTFEIKH